MGRKQQADTKPDLAAVALATIDTVGHVSSPSSAPFGVVG